MAMLYLNIGFILTKNIDFVFISRLDKKIKESMRTLL